MIYNEAINLDSLRTLCHCPDGSFTIMTLGLLRAVQIWC